MKREFHMTSKAHLAGSLAFAVTLSAGTPCGAWNQPVDPVAAAWAAHDVFAAERALSTAVPRDRKTESFYRGAVAVMFGRSVEGRAALEAFLASHPTDRLLSLEALRLLADDALRRDDYAGCADRLARVLSEDQDLLSEQERGELAETRDVAVHLRSVPPEISRTGPPARLETHRDAAGLQHLPAEIGQGAADPVFDTGANFSVASESFAAAHGIVLLPNSQVVVDSATGAKVSANLGTADVRVGNVRIDHAVFLVLKDQDLYIPQLSLQIPAILGFPILRALGHVRFNAGGSIDVGLKSLKSAREDLAFDGLTPLVRVRYAGQDVPFILDTGARKTSLSRRFESRFPTAFSTAVDRTVQRAGAGGVTSGVTRVLPTIALKVAGLPITLHDVGMGAEADRIDREAYGRAGQDVMFARGAFDLDLQTMRLSPAPDVPQGVDAPARP